MFIQFSRQFYASNLHFIGEKSEVYRDPITSATCQILGGENRYAVQSGCGAWDIEPLFHEAGRLRILGSQVSAITSFFEDIINIAQGGNRPRDSVYLPQGQAGSEWPSWDSNTSP